MKYIMLTTLVLVLGCSEAQNTSSPHGVYKESENFKYILSCIENKTWIAYQSAYKYWQLAGPIKDC